MSMQAIIFVLTILISEVKISRHEQISRCCMKKLLSSETESSDVTEMAVVLCSNCFKDFGLKHDAYCLGKEYNILCPNCKSKDGMKLDKDTAINLVYQYFVRGTVHRCEY